MTTEFPDAERAGLTVFGFGSGHGESVAVRLRGADGTTNWLVVDSCVDRVGGTNPAATLIDDEYVEDLTYFVVTHRHEDHVLGAVDLVDLLRASPHSHASVLVADRYSDIHSDVPPGSDMTTEVVDSAIRQALLALADAERDPNVAVEFVSRTESHTFPFGDATLKILAPPTQIEEPVDARHANQSSIVAWLAWGPLRILLAGDAPRRQLRDIAAPPLLHEHDLCKMPHHGSRSSIDPVWTTPPTERDVRAWLVAPYNRSRLPRVDVTAELLDPDLLEFEDRVHLTSLPVASAFRAEMPHDLTTSEYEHELARRADRPDALRTDPALVDWRDAMWWFHYDAPDVAVEIGRGRASILITADGGS